MQRLKVLLRQRLINGDRGASGVVVALMMVPIMIMAALAIDIAAMHADKQQLQTGADAAALAIAQDCARDDCSPLGAEETARSMAAANLNASGAAGEIADLDPATGEVSVRTSADREHWFAPIIGVDSSPIQARSSARWGYPTSGTAVMPLTFSACELGAQDGITVIKDPESNAVIGLDIPASTPDLVVEFTKTSPNRCTGRSGNVIPGGFGWIRPNGDCGAIDSVIGGRVESDPGASAPSGCTDDNFRSWIGKTVLLPIFDSAGGTGGEGEYVIFGYAAFTLSGYSFPGASYNRPSQCGGNVRCVSGSFDRFVDLSDDFDYSPDGPRLGAAVVALTE